MGCDVGGSMSINCYATDVRTRAYGPPLDAYRHDGMKVFHFPAESKFKMAWDCLLWRVDFHPRKINIIFVVNLSEDIELIKTPDYHEFLRVLGGLKLRDHNVIIAQPGEVVAHELLDAASSVWHSKRLLSGLGPLDLTRSFDCFNSPQDMEVLGMARLKIELQSHGLKCEGSLQECAARLFLLHSTSIKKKHRAKKNK